MKGFKQVDKNQFIEFVTPQKDDLFVKHQYDTNPPLICYMKTKLQSLFRVAYIEDNDGAYNNRPNKYYITTIPC